MKEFEKKFIGLIRRYCADVAATALCDLEKVVHAIKEYHAVKIIGVSERQDEQRKERVILNNAASAGLALALLIMSDNQKHSERVIAEEYFQAILFLEEKIKEQEQKKIADAEEAEQQRLLLIQKKVIQRKKVKRRESRVKEEARLVRDVALSRYSKEIINGEDANQRHIEGEDALSLTFDCLRHRQNSWLYFGGLYLPKRMQVKHDQSTLSKKILEWKGTGYPEPIVKSISGFLLANVQAGTTILAVPDKPDRKARMDDLVVACREEIGLQKKFRWLRGLFKFDSKFDTHHAGNKEARLELIDRHLISGKSDLSNQDILVIDDVYTTGATADVISNRLYLMGASSVDHLCLAKTVA